MSHTARVSLAVLALAAGLVFWAAPDVVLLAFAGVLLAILLDTGAARIAELTGLPRGWALATFSALIVGALVLFGRLAAPAIADQLAELGEALPAAAAAAAEQLREYAWAEPLIRRLRPPDPAAARETLVSTAGSAVYATFGTLGTLIVVVFTGAYLAVDPDLYRRGLQRLVAPSLRAEGERVLGAVGSTLRQWLLAQLVSMTVVGVLTGFGLWLVGLPLAPVLGLIAALLAFVPTLGPIIAAVPAVLLALVQGPSMVVWVVAVYLVVQTVESYLITPLIQQRAVALPPALVILVQVLFGLMFGLLGLMLATPIAAATITLIRETYVRRWLERERAQSVAVAIAQREPAGPREPALPG